MSQPTIIGPCELWHGDCLEVLPKLSGIDAVVTDPPYGIGYDASHDKYKNGIARSKCDWDVKPFDPVPVLALAKPTVMWGGNCFASKLPDHPGWLAWIKTVRDGAEIRQADMELAWTNCVTRSQTIRHLWIGAYRDSESGIPNVHPTQKPIRVMQFSIDAAKVEVGATVLDPYMGSGTTGIACLRTNRKFIGIEIDQAYFQIAKDRIQREVDQFTLPLEINTKPTVQQEMTNILPGRSGARE
jgi:site-specific DNA-methyltransferase (adenine-specific)